MIQLKRFMGLDTAITKFDHSSTQSSDREALSGRPTGEIRRKTSRSSRLARLIFLSNFAGLAILIGGALILNEMRTGLIQARVESLSSQAELVASVIAENATFGEPEASLDPAAARAHLRRLVLPKNDRVRLFAETGTLLADTSVLQDEVEELPVEYQVYGASRNAMSAAFDDIVSALPFAQNTLLAKRSLEEELVIAYSGERAESQRISERGVRIISVSVPVQYVSAVVGVVTIEADDVDMIVQRERSALMPFIGVAILIALLTSTALTLTIARPMRRLALAANRVQSGASPHISLPNLTKRKDEIGALTHSLEDMTHALSERIQANERFAADVAHEIKNPLTSIQSAIETAERIEDETKREKLRRVIASDVRRLDKLITDISNASRLEAEVARVPNKTMSIAGQLKELVDIYETTSNERDVKVRLDLPETDELMVSGREGPLGQVFRNIIENARSFSPQNGVVEVRAYRKNFVEGEKVVIRIDDSGHGIPEDRKEKIFERFYTDRPKTGQGAKDGAKNQGFSRNSGLGLSIAKQIIETHNGQIWCDNIKDAAGAVKGARFIIELPAQNKT